MTPGRLPVIIKKAGNHQPGRSRHHDAQRPACPLYHGPARKRKAQEGQKGNNMMNNENYLPYYQECWQRLDDPRAQRFLEEHGISRNTADAYWIGFDPEADPASAPWAREGDVVEKKHPCPRMIFPSRDWENESYIGIRTDGEEYFNQVSAKGTKTEIWGASDLDPANNAQEVFIVYDVIDALSIGQAGGRAVAIQSGLNVDALKAALEKYQTQATLILCDDKKRANVINRLEAALLELGVEYIKENLCFEESSINAALVKDENLFTEAVAVAARTAKARAEEAKKKYLEENTAAFIQRFNAEIADKADRPAISTGFYSLDQALDGGLYDGLYIMGAISSLGKTTFALQIMDNIAQGGHDVLIFSLEMARSELMAKSISRQTYLLCNGSPRNAKSTRGIMAGHKYREYSQAERDLIGKATDAYEEYAGRIFITEGVGNVGVDKVRTKIRQHILRTGRRPVVLIDYLQLLAPADPHFSDKQNTDRAVLELKRISRDYKIPVVAISSFNRDNYTEPVNLAAFKESGAIEYSSDVLIGLQYEGMDYQKVEKRDRDGNKKTVWEGKEDRESRIRALRDKMDQLAKDGEAQPIQVKILKNRNGTRENVSLSYRPIFNCFTDGKDKDGFEPMREADMPSAWR